MQITIKAFDPLNESTPEIELIDSLWVADITAADRIVASVQTLIKHGVMSMPVGMVLSSDAQVIWHCIDSHVGLWRDCPCRECRRIYVLFTMCNHGDMTYFSIDPFSLDILHDSNNCLSTNITRYNKRQAHDIAQRCNDIWPSYSLKLHVAELLPEYWGK